LGERLRFLHTKYNIKEDPDAKGMRMENASQ
jgi:hypothetical protein